MNNKKTEIIQTLKESYNRELRKQVVKRLLIEEKESDIPDYKIINQIFSYVLSTLGWDMNKGSAEWDSLPLDIMETAFPSIEKTQWFQEQILHAKKAIDIEIRDS